MKHLTSGCATVRLGEGKMPFTTEQFFNVFAQYNGAVTTIFTFGLLLWTDRKLPKYLLVIPLLWSIIGFLATINWGVSEDIMLLIAGWTATAMIWYRDRVTNEFIPKFSS